MSYEKASVDLGKAAKKVVVGGGLFLAGVLAGNSKVETEVQDIDGKKAAVVSLDAYGHASVATLAGTLALSAGLFSAEGRKKALNMFNNLDRGR